MFDGVISGADISNWLINNKVCQYARDQHEAKRIGDGLVSSGLVCTVAAGYHENIDIYRPPFSPDYGYIYRYPGRSATVGGVGSYAILSAVPAITITRIMNVESDFKPHSISFIGSFDGSEASTSSASKKSYVQYRICITVLDDFWEINRRYSEFVQFDSDISKLGIYPEAKVR